MEIRVVATVIVKPEFLIEVTAALHDMIEPSRQELGCLQYDLHQDIDHPETFIFMSVGRQKKRCRSIMIPIIW